MVYLLTSSELRKLVGFEITLFNVPGALKEISSIISNHNLNIYYIETCFRTEDEYILLVVIDFTDKDIPPENLLEEFRRSEYVKDVLISHEFRGLIYPSRFYNMDLGGIRGVIFAQANIRGIVEGIKEALCLEVGSVLLFKMGVEVGKQVYEVYAEKLGITNIDEAVEILRALSRGARWLDISEHNIIENKIIIKIIDSWECEIMKGKVDKPASHYIRGITAGFFKELLKKDVVVNETKCIAIGDPYCQFEVTIC